MTGQVVETTAVAVVEQSAAVVKDFSAQVLETFERDFAPKLAEKLALYQKCAAVVAELKATDAASLAVIDTWNKELLKEKDALEEIRLAGPGALNSLGRAMGKRFKPLVDVLEAAIANTKAEIGTYTLAERRKRDESFQAAAAAHAAGDHEGAQQALQIAAEAQPDAPKGNTVGEEWEVERYEIGLMVPSTDTYPGLAPDEKKIKAFVRDYPTHEHPPLPGVICKLVPKVSTRRA